MSELLQAGLDAPSVKRRGGERTAAWPTVRLFVLLWAVLIASVSMSLGGVMPLWAGCLVNTVTLYVLAHVNHEAIHRNISAGNPRLLWLNDAIGHFSSFWFFLPFLAFKSVHLAHHGATNDPENDADLWVDRKNPFAVFLACSTILVGYEFQLWKLAADGRLKKSSVVSIYTQRLLFIIVIAFAWSLGFGLEAFVLWVLPAMLVMPFLAFFFAYIVHYPHKSREPHQASNVLLAPRWLQPLVTAVFVFQNYHLVHHLNPRIPFYRYGEVFREIRPQLEEKRAAIKQLF